jgi:hypothetical protein
MFQIFANTIIVKDVTAKTECFIILLVKFF